MNGARAQVEAQQKRQADRAATLTTADARLAATAAQQAALERAAADLAAELASTEGELAAATAEEAAVRKLRDDAVAAKEKQANVVDDFVAQMAKLEATCELRRKLLDSLTLDLDATTQAVSAAEVRVGDLQAKQAAVKQGQADLEAIKVLRAKYADQP